MNVYLVKLKQKQETSISCYAAFSFDSGKLLGFDK